MSGTEGGKDGESQVTGADAEGEPKLSRWRWVSWCGMAYEKAGKLLVLLAALVPLLVYISGWWEGDPTITATILSNDPLLLQGIDNPNVEILVDGKPVKSPEKVRVLRFRVQNTSSRGVKVGDYVTTEPFALALNGYDVLEAGDITEASKAYLEDHVKPKSTLQDGTASIEFDKVQLNAGDWFIAQAWILPIGSDPPPFHLRGAVPDFDFVVTTEQMTRIERRSIGPDWVGYVFVLVFPTLVLVLFAGMLNYLLAYKIQSLDLEMKTQELNQKEVVIETAKNAVRQARTELVVAFEQFNKSVEKLDHREFVRRHLSGQSIDDEDVEFVLEFGKTLIGPTRKLEAIIEKLHNIVWRGNPFLKG